LAFQLLILTIVAVSLLVIVVFTLINGISPMPSSAAAARAIVDACKRHQAKGPILELGSGWGGVSLRLAKKFPDAQVIGFENCPVPYLWSWFVALISLRQNLKIVLGDFYKSDLSGAATIVCYLCPAAMKRLSEKLKIELRPGTLIVSSTFALPGWQPVETTTASDMYRSKIYVYRA
jgi:hypothetical protein